MRFIRTTNSQIEFIEANDNGQILNSIGLQLGEVYFQIKNGKVAFYLNDSEKPFDNFIWSTNIPLMIDDEVYETEDEVSEALHSIMNDSFQEQLDQLKEDLAAESARAEEAEAQLDDKIDDETSRAVSAETHLQDEITALSGTVATFDERITRNTNDISALTNTVNAEIARSTGKDAEHDALISGLTNSLNNEISRATSAETSLHNEILAETNRAQVAESGITANLNTEIQNRIADVDAEEARAIAAESGITANLNAEISRATTRENAIDDKVDSEIARSEAKDASHDAEISGLSTSLQNEINRAVGAENSLRNDLNAEIANRASGDTLLQSNIDAEIQNRINAVSGLTERVADDEASTGAALVDLNNKVNALSGENASQNVQISGLNASLNTEISRATGVENALRSDLSNETSARTTADAAQLQRITALEVGKADANNVYTKAESDAKYATKDYVSGLTDSFYTKNETNALLADKADKASAVSTALYNSQNKSIDFKNINGAVIASVDARDFIKDGMVDNVSISGSNLVITFNTDAGKEPISIPLSQIFDPSNYYTKSDINAYSASVETALNSKASQSDLSALSGEVMTISGDVITISSEIATVSGNSYTKTEVDNKLGNKADNSALTEHIGDTVKHITAAERNTWNAKSDFSGSYNDLTDKPTIPTSASQLTNDAGYITSSALNGYATEAYVTAATNDMATKTWTSGFTYDKQTIDNKIAQGGTFDPTLYYQKSETSGKTEISNALALKQNQLSAGTGIDITNNVISVTGGSQPVDAYTKAESDAKFATITNFNSHSGNTTVHITSAERTSWDAKPNVWCGDETAWSQISGSTQSGTIYLVY